MCADLISQINGLCLAQLVVCGARVASPPRQTVEFELVRALAHERRRAGEGPPLGGRDEGHRGGIAPNLFQSDGGRAPVLVV